MHGKTVFVYFAIPKVNGFSAYPTAKEDHHTASHFVAAALGLYLDPESSPVEVGLSTLECESVVTKVTRRFQPPRPVPRADIHWVHRTAALQAGFT